MSTLMELLAEEVMAQESKWWNVLVPVVEVVRADSAEAAVSLLKRKLDVAGFSPYESERWQADVFESEHDPEHRTGDFPDQGGNLPAPSFTVRDTALYDILADDRGADMINHDTVREQTGEDA
jgi:hypothetical protein